MITEKEYTESYAPKPKPLGANPGPWIYQPGSKTIRTQKENYWIATVDSWDGMVNNEANGALLAAAPELLAACRGALACIISGDLTQGMAVKRLREAIQKAKGEL